MIVHLNQKMRRDEHQNQLHQLIICPSNPVFKVNQFIFVCQNSNFIMTQNFPCIILGVYSVCCKALMVQQFHYFHMTDQTYISRGPCFNIPLFKNTKCFHVTKIADKHINRLYGKTRVKISYSGTFINLYLNALFTIT